MGDHILRPLQRLSGSLVEVHSVPCTRTLHVLYRLGTPLVEKQSSRTIALDVDAEVILSVAAESHLQLLEIAALHNDVVLLEVVAGTGVSDCLERG